jgi:hypothetical protein
LTFARNFCVSMHVFVAVTLSHRHPSQYPYIETQNLSFRLFWTLLDTVEHASVLARTRTFFTGLCPWAPNSARSVRKPHCDSAVRNGLLRALRAISAEPISSLDGVYSSFTPVSIFGTIPEDTLPVAASALGIVSRRGSGGCRAERVAQRHGLLPRCWEVFDGASFWFGDAMVGFAGAGVFWRPNAVWDTGVDTVPRPH